MNEKTETYASLFRKMNDEQLAWFFYGFYRHTRNCIDTTSCQFCRYKICTIDGIREYLKQESKHDAIKNGRVGVQLEQGV